MWLNQYEEHLAHSAPCNSRWDGFDRGDVEDVPRIKYDTNPTAVELAQWNFDDDIPF